MRNLFTNPSPVVNAGATRSGVAPERKMLQIVNGSAWITIEGEPDDYVLRAGDALELAPGRLVVVEACLDEVAFKVNSKTNPMSPPGTLNVGRRIASALQRAWRAAHLALRRPVRTHGSAANTVAQASAAQLSASGWRRLGHL